MVSEGVDDYRTGTANQGRREFRTCNMKDVSKSVRPRQVKKENIAAQSRRSTSGCLLSAQADVHQYKQVANPIPAFSKARAAICKS